jgi:hypothetical protein
MFDVTGRKLSDAVSISVTWLELPMPIFGYVQILS